MAHTAISPDALPHPAQSLTVPSLLSAYAVLFKFRVSLMVLITAAAGLYLGDLRSGVNPLQLQSALALIGIALVTCGSSVLNQVLQRAPGQLFGKGGVPKSVTVWQYLDRHGFTQLTTYQPASRFWAFQWIEGGWLLALSVLLIAVTVWLVRRRVV